MYARRLHKPAAALLLAFACAALVMARAAAAGDQGRTAAAAARVLARRSLRGIETSIVAPTGGNVSTKGLAEIVDNFLTGIANVATYGVENLKEHLSGGCNYGNWCGEKCPPPNGDGSKPKPPTIDRLDEICEAHDTCLSAGTACDNCVCHADMIAKIYEFLDEQDCALGENWANDRCQSSEAVKEAPTIAAAIGYAMDVNGGCGSQPWRDGCPSSSTSSEESSSSSSAQYRYTITVATSCESGSGTDGYVRVRVTDAKGAWFETADLNNAGNDRESCTVDTYERDPIDSKVLLNSDTTCEVNFRPAGFFPNWRPSYVKVVRASDSEETRSAKFCNDGLLSSEGWYTFSSCS